MTSATHKYTKKILQTLIFIFLFFEFLPVNATAQEQIWLGSGWETIYPLAGLHDRFESIQTSAFSIGWRRDDNSRVMLQYRFMDFNQVNRNKVPFDSLHMTLKNSSGGFLYQYEIFKPVSWFTVYIQAGITLNRWEFKRDAFYTVIQPDSIRTFAPVVVDLDKHKRTDWSWGGKTGIGFEFSPVRWLDMGWHGNAHLIAAELWPMLAINLENVSGLKMFEHQFYMRISYHW